MIEILEFVFSSFWTFVGTAMLLAIAASWTPIAVKNGVSWEEIKKLAKIGKSKSEEE